MRHTSYINLSGFLSRCRCAYCDDLADREITTAWNANKGTQAWVAANYFSHRDRMRLAIQAADNARFRQRLAFDNRYGRFEKCVECGAHNGSPLRIAPCLLCGGRTYVHRYSWPADGDVPSAIGALD